MDIYWNKIEQFNELNIKSNLNEMTESSQIFVSKYVPPLEVKSARSRTFEGNIKKSGANKDFTFNKQMWNL